MRYATNFRCFTFATFFSSKQNTEKLKISRFKPAYFSKY